MNALTDTEFLAHAQAIEAFEFLRSQLRDVVVSATSPDPAVKAPVTISGYGPRTWRGHTRVFTVTAPTFVEAIRAAVDAYSTYRERVTADAADAAAKKH